MHGVEGAARVSFTGSKAHDTAIRQRARKQGLKLNEDGVFKARACVASATEEESRAIRGVDDYRYSR